MSRVTALTLEVYTHVHGSVGDYELKDGVVASLLPSSQLVERHESDKSTAFLGWLVSNNNKPPAWAASYIASIPHNAKVEYLWPTAPNNLSAWSREEQGEVQVLPGAWTWQALAQDLTVLRTCVDALLQKAMRVQPIADMDNFFKRCRGAKS